MLIFREYFNFLLFLMENERKAECGREREEDENEKKNCYQIIIYFPRSLNKLEKSLEVLSEDATVLYFRAQLFGKWMEA